MSDYDWSRFRRSIFIKADPDRIFEAWTTPVQIGTWFLKHAVFNQSDGSVRLQSDRIQSGDTYAWQWWNYEVIERGRIKTVNRKERRLEFSFAGDCTVIVTVEVKEGDSLLRLEQTNIPLDEKSKRDIHMGCGQGWAFWMVNLKSWLDHGILLHDLESHHKNKDYEFCELINR